MDFIVQYMDHTKDETLKSDVLVAKKGSTGTPTLLEFNLKDKHIGKAIADAKDNLDKYVI